MKCICGFELEGTEKAALLQATRRHVDQAHADLGLLEGQLEDFVDSGLRARPWDGQRRELPADVSVRALAPGLAEDFLDFFDHEGFADNPAWGGCYCMAQHFDGPNEVWMKQRAADNRAAIRQRILEGTTSGALAYAEGRVIGWCNAGPRAHRKGLLRYPGVIQGPDEGVGAIVCYVISPWYRQQGLTRRLLDGALDLMRGQSLTVAEAYPFHRDAPYGVNFLGKVEMYRAAGFEQVREAGPVRVMRKGL